MLADETVTTATSSAPLVLSVVVSPAFSEQARVTTRPSPFIVEQRSPDRIFMPGETSLLRLAFDRGRSAARVGNHEWGQDDRRDDTYRTWSCSSSSLRSD